MSSRNSRHCSTFQQIPWVESGLPLKHGLGPLLHRSRRIPTRPLLVWERRPTGLLIWGSRCSRGFATALRTVPTSAARFPEHLSSAWPVAPCHLRLGCRAWSSTAGRAVRTRVFRRHGRKSQLVTSAARNDRRVLADLIARLAGNRLVPEAVPSLAAVPVHVVTPERDIVVPPAQALRFAEQIEADHEIAVGAGYSLPWVSLPRSGQPHSEPGRR